MPITGQDHFTDSDGTIITAHNADIGGSWIRQSNFYPAIPTIKSNEVNLDLDVGIASDPYTLGPVLSNGYAEVTYDSFLNPAIFLMLAVRFDSSSGMIILYPGPGMDTFTVFATDTGKSFSFSSSFSGSPTLRLEFNGPSVQALYNGTVKGSNSNMTGLTSGRCGFFIFNSLA